MVIEILSKSNIDVFLDNARGTYLEERRDVLNKYLADGESNARMSVVVCVPDVGAVGYATLLYKSHYPNFSKCGIPEITDLNVIEKFKGRGLAGKMLDYLENFAKEKGYAKIGLGVGLYEGYGAAQKLYIKRGYIPDGAGIFYDNKPVVPYEPYPIDDSIALYMVRDL